MRIVNCTQAGVVAEVDDDFRAEREPNDAESTRIATRTPVRSLRGDHDLLLHLAAIASGWSRGESCRNVDPVSGSFGGRLSGAMLGIDFVPPIAVAIDHADVVDDLDARKIATQQLLRQLLVIERIDVATEHDAIVLLCHFERTDDVDATAREDFASPVRESGNESFGHIGLHPWPAVIQLRKLH